MEKYSIFAEGMREGTNVIQVSSMGYYGKQRGKDVHMTRRELCAYCGV
jgi:hypothetical protein